MSSRSKASHAIQVFPFLAVLVCTMGALIFLLLLMTRQVKKREDAFAANEQAQRELAQAVAAAIPSTVEMPSEPITDPEPDSAPRLYVFPQLPEGNSKPQVLPDESYALELAQRERQIDELTTHWKVKAKQLKADRERKKMSIAKQKALVDAVLARTNDLQSDIGQLESELEQFASDADAVAMSADDRTEQRQIEKQISDMKKRLRAAKAAEANGEHDKFQVVPFDSQSGTTRRPILIECTAEGIRFLPENILITPADLNGFTPRANPLAAGTGALINYWNEWKLRQNNPKLAPDPYPLLLVRPDGVVGYYVAMKMLETIRTTHGYELIENSTVLKLPEVDPGAKEACQVAVQRLLNERESMHRAAVGGTSNGSGIGIGSSSRGGGGRGGIGGVERGYRGASGGTSTGSSAHSGSGGAPRLIDGASDRPGSQRAEGNVFTTSDLELEKEEVGSRSWERIENFQGQQHRRQSQDKESGLAFGQNEPSQSGSGLGRGSRAGGSRTFGFRTSPDNTVGSADDESDETAVAGAESPDAGTGDARSNPGKNAGKRTPRGGGTEDSKSIQTSATKSGSSGHAGTRGGKSGAATTNGEDVDGPSVTQGAGHSDTDLAESLVGTTNSSKRGSNIPVSSQERWSTNPDRTKRPGNFSESAGYVETEPGMPQGRRPGSPAGRPAANSGDTRDESVDDSSTDSEADDESNSHSAADSGSGSGTRSPSGRGIRLDSGPSLRTSRGSRSSSSSRQAEKRDKANDPDRKLEPEMLAGRHWGYSEAGATIGFERDVRISVFPDRLVVEDQHEIPVGRGESTQETFELFVMAIDRCSRDWGRPPQGFFWTPRLKFVVKPDATGRYEQISGLMSRAGVSTSQEFSKTDNTIEYGRDPQLSKKPVPKSTRKFSTGGSQ